MKMKDKYINAVTFNQFCENQSALVGVLNHKMTKIEENVSSMNDLMSVIRTDIVWLKKLLWAIFGVTGLAIIAFITKTILGV